MYKVYVLPSNCVDLHAWPNPKVLFLHIKARSFINISIWCLALGNVYLLFEKKVNVQLNCVSMGNKKKSAPNRFNRGEVAWPLIEELIDIFPHLGAPHSEMFKCFTYFFHSSSLSFFSSSNVSSLSISFEPVCGRLVSANLDRPILKIDPEFRQSNDFGFWSD